VRLPDLYQVLGVPRDASSEDIKRTYRRLARELHPDVNKDPEAERRFKEITAACQTLSDPARRQQYDVFGSTGMAPGDFTSPFGDLGDVFDVFFGGGGFGGRRRGSRRRSRVRRGDDLFVQLTMTFEQAAFGVRQDIPVEVLDVCGVCAGSGCQAGTHPSRCTRCGGTGELQDVSRSVFGTVMTARACTTCDGSGEEIAAPCRQCQGEGRVPTRHSVAVEVPAGVADGMELRVASEGHAGRAGGQQGDLYVSLRVEPHPVFERRGQDLVCALAVPMTQAALGADLTIPTLEGEERVRIEPGTASGTVLRLRGRGVPHLGRRGRGDLYVTVQVETPSPGTKEERALMQKLAELRGEGAGTGTGILGNLRKLLDT
jgi:molecular chaperone DnaJ